MRTILSVICVVLVAGQLEARQISGRSNPGPFKPRGPVKSEQPAVRLMAANSTSEIELTEPVRLTGETAATTPQKPQLATGEPSVVVRGIVRDSSGVVFIYVNGEEVEIKTTKKGAEFASTVLLAMGENKIEIKAVNRSKREKKLSFLVLREEIMIKGKYYALVIAVQDYLDPRVRALQFPVQDAKNLMSTLTNDYTFDQINITFLKNPKRSEIINEMDNLSKRITRDDNLLIFYAGHGYFDEQMRQGFWLPADAAPAHISKAEWISNGTIRDYVAGIQTKHTLLISDACFSGGIFKTREAFSAAPPATRELYRLPSRKAITSGTLKEVPDRSVFVEFLVKRLKENSDPLLTAETLFITFRQAVINNSPNRQVPQYGEIQQTGDEGGDFLFVRREK